MTKLNVKPAGGNYDVFRRAVKHFEIDTSHFRGQGWNRGDHSGLCASWRKKRDLKDILQEGTSYKTYDLKRRLIAEGLKEHKCEMCGITEWNGQPTPTELDHINGVRTDNRLENLRILCPNCHAQTKTYRGKNINKVLTS